MRAFARAPAFAALAALLGFAVLTFAPAGLFAQEPPAAPAEAPAAPHAETPASPAEAPAAPAPEKFELSVEAGGAAMTGSRTLAENLSAAKDLSKFTALAGTGGLAETLAGPGPYTVFAPLDRAFLEAPKDVASLLGPAAFAPETPERARRIAAYHIVPGRHSVASLLAAIKAGGGQVKLATLDGQEITVRNAGVRLEAVDGRGEAAAIVTSDAPQKNGLLHVIDGVLTPKS